MNSIVVNLARVRATIAAAALAAGRKPHDVSLIAISKTHPLTALEAALGAGQFHFGESTAQEALTKISALRGRDAQWHFIGHLQSNKAKFIPGNFHWLHSLDSVKLAQRLARLAQEQNAVVNTLIEVNITRDPNKHGVAPETLFALLDQLTQTALPGIQLRGLMAIGPHAASEKEIRTAFAAVRTLRDAAAERFGLATFDQLSLGMSDDYPQAIAEGSTMVRIGTAIFGARDYQAGTIDE